MKDLSLSLLSRGCGRFVSSNRNTGRHNGRLDVCFTPQDYYIWRSQDSLLHLSNRGSLLVGAESTLPKTYSTRRGPLLLYSQDLVTMEISCPSETRDRKQRVVPQYTQEVQQHLNTVKELTAAVLSYSNNQFNFSRLGPPFFPPCLSMAPDLRRSSLPPIHTAREQSNSTTVVQFNTQGLPAETNTEQPENQPDGQNLADRDKEEEQGSRKSVRLDLFLQIPCNSRTSTSQMEPQPWAHCVSVTSKEEAQTYLDMRLQHTESSQHTEINQDSMGGELHHPYIKYVCDAADDQVFSIADSEKTSDKGNYERSMSANRHGRIGLLPPLAVGQSVCHGPCWEKKNTVRPRWEGPSSDEYHAQRLPPIAESHTAVPGRPIQAQTQKDAQPKAKRAGFQSQENLNQLHQQPLFLPLLCPGKEEEIHGKQRGEKTERLYFKKETVGQVGGGGGGGQGGGGRLPSEKGSTILLEPGEEPLPPVGVLGCVAGRRGPGKQSSLAFLQNRLLDLQDPCESSDASRGVVRGILPLELRDLQSDKPVGSLILGPDGEVIQLSVYDNSLDPSQGDGDRQEHALQVLSAEGETLPWIVVLHPEQTYTVSAEGGVELNPDDDIQQHQSTHKLLDLDRSTEHPHARSPSSHTNSVAVNKKKTSEKKSAETVAETWKAAKKDAKHSVRMPPLREEEPREGSTKPEEKDEEEELDSTGQTNHLSGSHQPGEKLQFKNDVSRSEQNINVNEATEDAGDKKGKRKDAVEAAATTGKMDMDTVTSEESDGQKTSKMRMKGRWQRQKTGSDAQSIRSHKQEERSSREAAETLDHSGLPSKNKMRGEREVKINEEKEKRGEVARRKKESTGKRGRGRLTQKESVVGNHEDPPEKVKEINLETEEESHLKSTKRLSATQRDNNKTKSNPEEDTDTDHLSTSTDKPSRVRSVSSLRSPAAASQINHRSRRSAASSCEGAVGLASSRGCLSSCSTVMVTEDQLMLNPVKPELFRKSQEEEEEEAAALRLAQQAERQRQEVERKRQVQEEEERKQQEREQTEERMKSELEEERKKRAEEHRLKRLEEEEKRKKHEEEDQERARREQVQRERERRRQEERRRQMERHQRMREEEEQRRKAELERLRLEEEKRQEEESKKLQEMDESERIEYLHRKEQEENDRRSKEEKRKRTEEEAALQAAEEARLQAETLARQMALLQQQLAIKRGLVLEAGGLERTQGISRPWIYSYFTLLQLLGLNPTKAETMTP